MHNSIFHSFFILLCCYALLKGDDMAETVHRESIIAQSSEFENELEKSGLILKNESLNAYLNGVLNKIAESNQFTVKVIQSPAINALTMANGTIFICTGLLARIGNEAQLAALLGHELVHIIRDHSVQNLVNTKKLALSSANKQIGFEIFFGSLATSVVNYNLQSAISGYSRDLEREADSLGLKKMRKAGYARIEFRNLFLILKKTIELENIKQPYFFSTHPAITERINNYYHLAGKNTIQSARGLVNSESYSKIIQSILQSDGNRLIASGQLDYAEANFSRILDSDSGNALACVQLGNIARLRSAPEVNKDAFKWYYRAKDYENSEDALRELGFYYFKSGNTDSATYYLKAYQTQYPLSPYKPVVEDYLKKCLR
ncbi:MAG TPA: M48 family metalloprotease [Chitinispirillaceae bacterium]|nr:M48 family metalloprotease [Chitinispirillaceae bacterium]